MMGSSAEIWIKLAWGTARSPRLYAVAGQQIGCSHPLEVLEPFRISGAAPRPAARTAGGPPDPKAQAVYGGSGWVGGLRTAVECRRAAAGYWIEVEGAGSFHVGGDGGAIVELPADSPRPRVSVEHAVVGPALSLALALRGVYCLHASAGSFSGRVVGFLGASGAGKSTLAAFLDGRGRSRVADDSLPVAPRSGRWEALPGFPQLKLGAARQWTGGCGRGVGLAALYVLAPVGPSEPASTRRLGATEAALALVRHTVAGRLFDSDLAAAHLDAMGDLASGVRVFALEVPRDLGRLNEVAAVIDRTLG